MLVHELSLSTHTKKVPGSNLGRACLNFACSPPSKEMHGRLIGDSKSAMGMR